MIKIVILSVLWASGLVAIFFTYIYSVDQIVARDVDMLVGERVAGVTVVGAVFIGALIAASAILLNISFKKES